MTTELLFKNIERHIHLSATEKDRLSTLLQEASLNKREFLLRQGASCKHIYFVNSGILRAYYVSREGKDSTIMFATSNWWITDMHCFLNELPSMVNIQVVEPAVVLKLSKRDLETLYLNMPQFNVYFRILIQNAYCREQLRTMQNLSLPAKDRYEHFLKKYPAIAASVTLKQIASYLGITPEFLSAIRAQKEN